MSVNVLTETVYFIVNNVAVIGLVKAKQIIASKVIGVGLIILDGVSFVARKNKKNFDVLIQKGDEETVVLVHGVPRAIIKTVQVGN